MRLTVLGCAGGIGGRERFTTSFRVDDDILIDAGTGVSVLELDALAAIDHVFLTHAHLDHVCGLAFLLDSVLGRRRMPVTVHATTEVLETLQRHLFNWNLWPDFTQLPDSREPMLAWAPIAAGKTTELRGRTFLPLVVEHTVPAAGYIVTRGNTGFVFSGDTARAPVLWAAVGGDPRLRHVVVECSFPDAEAELAAVSKHYCPAALVRDLAGLPADVEILITHLKPGSEAQILAELRALAPGRRFHDLHQGDSFTF